AVRNWKVLEQIAGKTNLIIDFGGGIKTKGDVDILINSGAAMVTIGSLAVKNEALLMEWILHYGAALFLLGADVKDEKIAINGWKEKTEIGILDFVGNWISKDLNRIFCTDVNLDGLLKGPSFDLYKRILEKFPKLNLIASGGVSSMDDIYQLKETGCSGIIIGKAIYEGRLKLSDISKL
ncbi:MAG: HisA/HisF-related TIM barrel protein, partial [Chitinophagales bacterium]